MANTREQIEIDYRNTIRKAQRLRELAGELEGIRQSRIGGSLNNLPGAWRGDASAMYDGKLRKLDDKVRKRIKELRNAADGIEKAAKRLHDAEMYGLSLFGG